MKIRKILKIIGIILIVLIVIGLIYVARNYIIIKNLQNKISEYKNSTNFYVKTVASETNGTTITMESYTKDNKQVVFIERNLNNEIIKMSIYDNGEKINMYIETAESKIVRQDVKTIMVGNIYNSLEVENNWQTFLSSLVSKIRAVKYNNKECYVISDFMSLSSLSFDKQTIYVEKDTGLLVKVEANGIITEREQSFNNVNDLVFVEPDISQYTLQKDN